MSAVIDAPAVDLAHFRLPPELEATEPPELTLGRRDAVRMLVSIGDERPRPSTARDLSSWLQEGDLVVVNTSATIPAAIDATAPDGRAVVVHLSTELPTGLHLVEVRRQEPNGSTTPDFGERAGESLALAGGGVVRILGRMPGSVRLWVATLDLPAPLLEHLCRFGRPIRYGYVPDSWPITAYTNSFSREPGSAEMPSAGRVLTADVITDLVANGIVVAPIVLHTGVASLEAHEMPYPERYRVPVATARLVNATRDAGGRVVAIGTTVVRALETAAAADGVVHPGSGWTELVITPARGVRVVDGLLTGWHEPAASHLQMLEAVAGRRALELAYGAALAAGYRWHEFGDVHLILPERR
ncbi:MAG TPA: S-adenosylmethionine:tRNA ribosyltransferase-isomerase [Ilumatobacteraceae bacterium]|nr:S-adenosylmethionine:tRNA ribosyltransferase-isomerase [Ilumatobacteraceae bacterium]